MHDGVQFPNGDNQAPITSVSAREWLHNLRKTQPLLYRILTEKAAPQGDLHGYQLRLKHNGERQWPNMDPVNKDLTAVAVAVAVGDAISDRQFPEAFGCAKSAFVFQSSTPLHAVFEPLGRQVV